MASKRSQTYRNQFTVIRISVLALLCHIGPAFSIDPDSTNDLFLGIKPDAKKGYQLITTKPMGRPVMKVADVVG